MKSITLYNGYELVYNRNPYGSHGWMLKDRDGEEIVNGNVNVANELRELWPEDKVVEAIVSTMYIGDPDVARYGWSLGDQHFWLSIGKRCRKLQTQTGCKTLPYAYAELKHPHCHQVRGYRALDYHNHRRSIA